MEHPNVTAEKQVLNNDKISDLTQKLLDIANDNENRKEEWNDVMSQLLNSIKETYITGYEHGRKMEKDTLLAYMTSKVVTMEGNIPVVHADYVKNMKYL